MRNSIITLSIAALLALGALPACEQANDAADDTTDAVENAADTVGDATEEAVDTAQDAAEEAADTVEDGAEEVADDTPEAPTASAGDTSAATSDALAQVQDVFNQYVGSLTDLTDELSSVSSAADAALKGSSINGYVEQVKNYWSQIESSNPELVAQVKEIASERLGPLTERFQAEAGRIASEFGGDSLTSLLDSVPLFK